jgi:hypothetical protein
MPAALAKFWPSMWLVPACSALPSRISDSMACCVDRTRKGLAGRLDPLITGMASQSSAAGPIALEAGGDLVGRLLLGGVKRVRLLPQELGGAQEEACAQLPAHDVVPQVEQQRQVAIRLDPVLDLLGDDRLARRPDGQPLGQLSPPAWVTHAICGLKPSTCSASFSSRRAATNRGSRRSRGRSA